MILPITEFPNKILRQPAQPVLFPLAQKVKKLTKDMFETVKVADGIGLAAPQVGESIRLVVIDLEKSGMPPFALYNPKIVKKSFKRTEVEEGCLSVQGVFGLVKRPKKVKIQAQNAKGEKVVFEDDGWIARVVQHEIDHIQGILIINRTKKFTQGADIVKGWKKEKLL